MTLRLCRFHSRTISPWLLLASLSLFVFISCNKDDASISKSLNSPTGGTQAALDSTSSGSPVEITEKNHRLLLRPKVGTTQRYRIVTRSVRSQDISDQLFNGPQGKKTTTNATEYYLRQNIRAVKPDSSVDVTFRIDSVKFNLTQDTSRNTT